MKAWNRLQAIKSSKVQASRAWATAKAGMRRPHSAGASGVRGNFFAKHTLCRPPLGWFMRAAGAIPVVRRRTENLVDSAVAALADHEQFYLGLAPEGTRRYTDHWRTGFYHIAERSGARILLMYADYGK